MKFYEATAIPLSDQQLLEQMESIGVDKLKECFSAEEVTLEMFREFAESRTEKLYKNDKYQVAVLPVPEITGEIMIHLSIKRLDKEPIRDWRELQKIKNAIVGTECEGVELYPAESRLVDSANQYHIYCFVDPEYRFPFGMQQRFVTEKEYGGTKQRKFG
jgi:hypothetical protein